MRLSGVSAGRWPRPAAGDLARSDFFLAPAREGWEVCLPHALARDGELAVFVRTPRSGGSRPAAGRPRPPGRPPLCGWTPPPPRGRGGQRAGDLPDGGHSQGLLFDAKGLPGETFPLELEGRIALEESSPCCATTLDRGRPGPPRPVAVCGRTCTPAGPGTGCSPMTRCGRASPSATGEHGALLRRGRGAVLAASLTLTYGAGGNIPRRHAADLPGGRRRGAQPGRPGRLRPETASQARPGCCGSWAGGTSACAPPTMSAWPGRLRDCGWRRPERCPAMTGGAHRRQPPAHRDGGGGAGGGGRAPPARRPLPGGGAGADGPGAAHRHPGEVVPPAMWTLRRTFPCAAGRTRWRRP